MEKEEGKPVENTADVLRRLANDLDEDYGERCGRVAIDLVYIGAGIIRELVARWGGTSPRPE